jgi:flagellar basal-body rod modification protein FlgD
VPIDAIGRTFQGPATADGGSSVISQQDFIRLFLAQLRFQDPLEPVDNREFLAQLAQFSNLEQARINGDNIANLLDLTVGSQALSLLGKTANLGSGSGATAGQVIAVRYTPEGPVLTLRTASGEIINDARLSQVSSIIQP